MTEYDNRDNLFKQMARIVLDCAIYSGPGYANAEFQEEMHGRLLSALAENEAEITFRTAENNQ